MRHILLAPDGFKGTLSAREVCEIEMQAIREVLPDAFVTMLPLSDGGEDLAETGLMIFGGERVSARVTGPDGTPVTAEYAMLPDGSAAMEMSGAAGLTLMHGHMNPLHATTYGVGELLLDAKRRGAKKVVLGLGGSATNDCGIGMAAALGCRFFDHSGAEVAPFAGNLGEITRIELPERGYDLPVLAACDVDNPLLGEHGATHIFGPQKGVTEDILPELERGMASFSAVLARTFPDFSDTIPGTGAAGGTGAAVLTVLHGSLRRGIDLVLDALHFDELLSENELVITGEGRLDMQTRRGKVPLGVLQRAVRAGVPCIAICGSVSDAARCREEFAFSGIYAASEAGRSMEEVKKTCREDLLAAAKRAMLEQIKQKPSLL